MKKVIIVSKTHLDLGFTDYASNIKEKYIKTFIPNAIQTAENLNKNGKRFVWTTGSWILKECLKLSDDEGRNNLIKAIKNGDVVAHALPFTTHTELLDSDTLEYGLSIIDEIDKISGVKTIACKMTDVPGHTISMVPYLAKHGIKLIHIGVNGASTLPDVPPCFLWKYENSAVVVIYSGDYGGEFRCDFIDDILYFDHSLDNHGAPSEEKIDAKFKELTAKYPDYKVKAGRLDEIAEKLWDARDRLPIIENEIGDTWIHGVGTDCYKVGALKELYRLKNKWLFEGTIKKDSEEYTNLCDNLLCICEHTWGMDVKIALGDYTHNLRLQFDRARKANKIKINPFLNFPYNFIGFFGKLLKLNKIKKYSDIEKSWQEQRDYLSGAVSKLSQNHLSEVDFKKLIPKLEIATSGNTFHIDTFYKFGDWQISINKNGGIKSLTYKSITIIDNNEKSSLEYHSYSDEDYKFWQNNYLRNFEKNKLWAIPDFTKPNLNKINGRYPHGLFGSSITSGFVNTQLDKITIRLNLSFDSQLTLQAGAPKKIIIKYILSLSGLKIELEWFDKPANRLPESLILRLFPTIDKNTLKYFKLGYALDPLRIVPKGNRKLSAVEKIIFKASDAPFEIINLHSPLVELGEDNIMRFDDKFPPLTDGLSFILQNNLWGTNFPLWYSDNAHFEFKIKKV